MLVDTHCHIHESEYFGEDRERAYDEAVADDISMLCVSTTEQASREAIAFCETRDRAYPVIGVHPHEVTCGWDEIAQLVRHYPEIAGIGEIGLDYFYMHAPRELQITALEAQLQVAVDAGLPVSFHVRETTARDAGYSVWRDFWPIIDNFSRVRAVMHSFTDTVRQRDEALSRGFYIGVNGICTFTKDKAQQDMFRTIPLERIVLETDAPFLTPAPLRGRMNEPKYVRRVAEHVAASRAISLDAVSRYTTDNASQLFTKLGEAHGRRKSKSGSTATGESPR